MPAVSENSKPTSKQTAAQNKQTEEMRQATISNYKFARTLNPFLPDIHVVPKRSSTISIPKRIPNTFQTTAKS